MMKQRPFIYGPIDPKDIITLEQISADPAIRDAICPPAMRRYVRELLRTIPDKQRPTAKGKAS